PLQFANGASIDLGLPPGTNAGYFNFDPEAVVTVQGPDGGAPGPHGAGPERLSLPAGTDRTQPGAGWTESLALRVGDWGVLVPVGTEGQPNRRRSSCSPPLTTSAHTGYGPASRVLDVSAPFRLGTTMRGYGASNAHGLSLSPPTFPARNQGLRQRVRHIGTKLSVVPQARVADADLGRDAVDQDATTLDSHRETCDRL
ncbi:MAG: hypothetical protein QOD01_1048, partial [Actinomycetota bacterium]|nr:hypothetical protein [Actinomycetota bacterium]